MEIVMLVCLILITIAILAGTVYFVRTMIQVRKTASEIQGLAKKVDNAFPILNLITLGSNLVALIANKIKSDI